MPEISVIIPNYNHARFLEKRIESVIGQTVTDLEIIILDDASTDNSRDLIEAYAHKDQRIKCMFNSVNSGSPFAQWQKGIEAAAGQYIWIAESDDFSDITFLESVVSVIDRHPSAGLVFTQSYNTDEQDMVVELNRELALKSGFNAESDFFEKGSRVIASTRLLETIIPNASAVVFKRQLFFQTGGISPVYRMVGDWLVWLKIMMETDVYYIARPLNYFRSHRSTTRADQFQSKERFSLKYAELYTLYRDFFNLYPWKGKRTVFSYVYRQWYWNFTLSSIGTPAFMRIAKAGFRADALFGFRMAGFLLLNSKHFLQSLFIRKSK